MKWLPDMLGSRAIVSDEQAMRHVQASGDPRAFGQLLSRWDAPIRRLCIRMTGDEHRGEDLAQEAFARVFAHREQFDASRRFSTWLWRIAINLCHEEARRAGRRGEVPMSIGGDEPMQFPCPERAPPDRAQASEGAERVRLAMAKLPDSHRAVVVLREYEGLKFREISEVLGVPEGTVKWHMSEALNQLRRELKSMGPEGVMPAIPASRVKARATL
jgi:RNA polymerase sigma-70 factor (ECF subfamily)